MALGQSITDNDVRGALGVSIFDIFTLCTQSVINKWSKYKPVRDAGFGANWPSGSSGKYGLNLPTNWDYLGPGGGSEGGSPDEPGRLDDFRGYEHSKLLAFPSIQCRDTDNDLNAILYPSNTPYLQRWYCRAYRSASSVIILPSDLGLDSYYVGLKLSFGGATWYKTFGQVSSLDFTKNWNILVSAEIVTWSGTPAYSNFPYGTGQCDWQLILCSTAAAAWTNGAPSDIIYFPADTDGTNTFITSGSFTVHDWIKLSDYDMVFSAAAGYLESIVYCSTANLPAFTITDNASWITLAVYDGETLISNPALYAPGMKVRVSVSALATACIVSPEVGVGQDWTLDGAYTSGSLAGAASRSGTATVTSEGEDAVISVDQGNAGSNQLTFAFRSIDLGAGDTPIDVVIKRGSTTVFSDATGTFVGRDGYTKQYTVTINETGIAGETYTVTLTRH